MTEYLYDQMRAWAEFPDPDSYDPETDRTPDQIFRIDLTWLTSNYNCIFGAGCQGIYDERPDAGCCTLGAHFSDDDDIKRVKKYVKQLTPETWEKHDRVWTEPEGDATKTRVVDGACIFFNSAGFPAGMGCALHGQALRNEQHPLETKPDVCWQVPISRTYRTVELMDESEYLEVTITEYDRRRWGEGGHDLDWYCTANDDAHTGAVPLYKSSEAELRELMNDAAYEELARLCEEYLENVPKAFVHRATASAAVNLTTKDKAQQRLRRDEVFSS